MTLRDKLIERLAELIRHDVDRVSAREREYAAAAFDAMTPPLVWNHAKGEAVWSCGDYTIIREGQVFEVWLYFADGPMFKCPTQAAAQAAAEDHYLRQRYAGTKLMEGLDDE